MDPFYEAFMQRYGANKSSSRSSSSDPYLDSLGIAAEKRRNKKDEEDEIKKRQEEIIKELEEEEKKKEDEKGFWDKAGDLGASVGEGIVTGTQQVAGKMADVTIKGGTALAVLGSDLAGGTQEEKDRRAAQYLETAEGAREWIKDRKDISGENISGSKDIGINDIKNDPRKAIELAAEGLDVGLGATMFMNPTRIAAGAARGAGKTGLTIGKQASTRLTGREAAKYAARDAAFFGGLEGGRETAATYAETGDVGQAFREGGMAGLSSGVLQGGMDVGFYGVGSKFRKKDPVDPTKVIDDTIDGLTQAMTTERRQTRLGGLATRTADQLSREEARIHAEATENLKTAIRRQGKTYEAGIADLDSRMQEVNTPEYQQMHKLTKIEEAEARFEELTSDVQNMPGVKEATNAIEEAQQQVDYYNNLRVENPFARKVDKIRDKVSRIDAARQTDLEELARMREDPESGFNPDSFDQLVADVNTKYDEAIKIEQGKIDTLMESNPEQAMELQALDQAERTVLEQRNAAQEAVDAATSEQMQFATQERDRLMAEPDPEKITYHTEAIQRQKETLQKALEDAKVRYENPNDSLKDVDTELDSLDDGTHPLVETKAKPEKIASRKVELYEERAQQQVKAIETSTDTNLRELSREELDEIASIKSEEALDESIYLKEAVNAKGNIFASILPAFQQNEAIMRHLGLEKLNQLRLSSSRKHASMTFDAQRKLKRMQKEGRGLKSSELFDAADGVPGAYDKLDPRGKALVDEWRDWAKDLGKKLGLPEDLVERGEYIPHLMAGKGNSPKILQLQTRMRDAIKKAEGGLQEDELKRTITYIKKLDDEILELIEPDKRVEYSQFVKDNGNIANRFLEKRTGAEGYERNFMKAIDAYVDRANTQIAYEDYVKESARIINEKGMNKTIVATLQSDINNIRGMQAEIDKNLNMSSNNLVASMGLEDTKLGDMLHNAPTKAIRNTRILSSLAMFAGNIASGVNAIGQTPAIAATLNADGLAVGMARASKTLRDLGKETLTRSEKASVERFQRIGVFEGSSPFIPDRFSERSYVEQNIYGGLTSWTNNIVKASMTPLTGGDRMMRLVTAHGAEFKGKQRGLSGDELDNYIVESVRRANSDFSKLQAPRAFRSQVGKTVAQAVAWIPGMTFRMAESMVEGGKGATTIVAKYRGKDITAGELNAAVDDLSKALFGAATVWGVGMGLEQITGQGEVVPNPLDKDFYNTPFIQRIVGNEDAGKAGLLGLLPSKKDAMDYDDNGNLVNVDHRDRVSSFFSDTLPRAIVPGYSAYRRTKDAMEVNEKGYSETDSGRIRFMADEENNAQRLIFGQYSTPEGREYIENMNMPGGGSLSERDTNMIKEAPEQLQNQYYEFFRASDRATGRTEANKEVSKLFKEGRPEAARRKAEEFNAKVDKQMAEFFQKYPSLDDDLMDELRNNIYITLTERSEAARSR